MEEEKKINNLEFWEKYKAVPKNAVKAFDNGTFKGTDINTMWRLKCLTETFGMCGFGWYYNLKRTWVETTQNSEQFAFAEIELFIKKDDQWSMPIVGTGGNKLTRVKKDGTYMTSDEAFKMAITDAIGVACRNLGIGADVYWENDRTKYTEGDKQRKEDETQKREPIKVEQPKVDGERKIRVCNDPQYAGLKENAATITDMQILRMRELNINLDNACEYLNVPSIDLMSVEQADYIIKSKEAKVNK